MERILPRCLWTDLVIPNLFVGNLVIDDHVLYKMIFLYSFVCFLSVVLTLFPFLLPCIATASIYVTSVVKKYYRKHWFFTVPRWFWIPHFGLIRNSCCQSSCMLFPIQTALSCTFSSGLLAVGERRGRTDGTCLWDSCGECERTHSPAVHSVGRGWLLRSVLFPSARGWLWCIARNWTAHRW